MAYALRRLALAVALATAWAPIVALKWWSFLVTLPAFAVAFAVDPDLDGSELDSPEALGSPG